MAVGDYYTLTTCCYTPDQIGLNRTYWKQTAITAAGVTDAEAADAFDNTFHATYKAWMSASAKWRGVSWRKVAIPTPLAATSITRDGVGTAPQGNLPTQVSGIITLRTPVAKGRGRVYPPFPSVEWKLVGGGMTAAGAVALAQISALYAAPNVVLGAGGTATYELQVYWKGLPGPIFYGFDPVVQVATRDRFATQRRRGQFGRINTLPF